jgi:hypothetical protein
MLMRTEPVIREAAALHATPRRTAATYDRSFLAFELIDRSPEDDEHLYGRNA